LRATRGRMPVARAAKQVGGAGQFGLVVTPNAKARTYLARDGRLRAVVHVTFTPTGGRPSTQSLRVVLKR
jgi:hypothetical protein